MYVKKCIHTFSPFMSLLVKVFLHGSPLGMTYGPISLNRMKWLSLEWHRPTSFWKKKFNVSPSAMLSHGHASVAERMILVDIMPEDKTIISGLYIQHLKSCTWLSGEFAQEYYWTPSSTWKHKTTPKYVNTGSNHEDRLECSSPFIPPWTFLTYLLTYLLTYSMEQSPSWEANWFCS